MNNNIYNITFTYIPSLGGGIEESRDGMHMDSLQGYMKFLRGEYENKHTREIYQSHVKQFIEHTNGTINTDTIDEYKAFLNKKYKNRNTRNHKIIAINIFLDWLGRTDLRMKEIGWDYPSEPTLKDKDINKILKRAERNPELHLITLFLWEGCLRDKTITDIKITDRIDNKLYLKRTKTGNKTIILSQRMMDAWNNYLEVRPEPKPEYKEYLFINPYRSHKGEKFQTILPIIKRIKNLAKQCDISIPVTPYTIRRTSGTLRQDKFSRYYAGDVKIVQRLFNHKDVRTTLRYDQRTDYDVERYLESIYKHGQPKYKHENCSETTYKEGLDSFSPQLDENEDEDNRSASFSFISFEAFFVVGAGNGNVNPIMNYSSFSYENIPPSYIHQTPSPALPIDVYLDDCDYGRACFASHPFLGQNHSPLLDHIGREIIQNGNLFFSFLSSPPSFPSSLLNPSWGCNINVTRYTKMDDVGCNTILRLSYLKFTILYTKV